MTSDDTDLGRRLRDLAALADGAQLPPGRAVRALGERRRVRRRRTVLAAVALAAAGAVIAGVLSGSTNPHVVPTAPTRSTTTTLPASQLARAARSLRAYVAGLTAADATAFAAARRTTPALANYTPGGPVTSVESKPVEDRGGIVAVAAFSYSANGRPVRVLSYGGGRWRTVALLGPDLGAPVQPRADRDLLGVSTVPVDVADVTGDGRPDFLVHLTAATNSPGVVVSQDGGHGHWRYVPNAGPFTTSDVLARTPAFKGGRLVTVYNDCTPDCASGAQTPVVWTYEPTTGDFWAPDPPGDTRPNRSPQSAAKAG
jgi:hypothetical protein